MGWKPQGIPPCQAASRSVTVARDVPAWVPVQSTVPAGQRGRACSQPAHGLRCSQHQSQNVPGCPLPSAGRGSPCPAGASGRGGNSQSSRGQGAATRLPVCRWHGQPAGPALIWDTSPRTRQRPSAINSKMQRNNSASTKGGGDRAEQGHRARSHAELLARTQPRGGSRDWLPHGVGISHGKDRLCLEGLSVWPTRPRARLQPCIFQTALGRQTRSWRREKSRAKRTAKCQRAAPRSGDGGGGSARRAGMEKHRPARRVRAEPAGACPAGLRPPPRPPSQRGVQAAAAGSCPGTSGQPGAFGAGRWSQAAPRSLALPGSIPGQVSGGQPAGGALPQHPSSAPLPLPRGHGDGAGMEERWLGVEGREGADTGSAFTSHGGSGLGPPLCAVPGPPGSQVQPPASNEPAQGPNPPWKGWVEVAVGAQQRPWSSKVGAQHSSGSPGQRRPWSQDLPKPPHRGRC